MLALALLLAAADPAAAPPSSPPAAAPAPPAPTTTAQKSRVLVLDLQAVGVDKEQARLVTGVVAALAAENPSLEIVTGADLRSLVEVEASKQQLGCGESSCLAELAGALDAKLVIYGDVGRLGDAYVVNLSLFDGAAAKAAGRATAQVESIDAMRAKLRPTVNDLLTSFGGIDAGGGTSPLVVAGGITAGVGVAAAAGLVGVAFIFDGIADDAKRGFNEKNGALQAGLGCLAGAGVGVLAALAGGGILALGLATSPEGT